MTYKTDKIDFVFELRGPLRNSSCNKQSEPPVFREFALQILSQINIFIHKVYK